MALHQLFGAFDASRDDAGRGVLLEALAERPALAPVESKHRAIQRETGKCAVEHRPRDAGGRGFARHGGQESVESPPHVAAPAGAARRRVQNRIPSDRSSMLFLNVRPGDHRTRNRRGKAVKSKCYDPVRPCINGPHQDNVSSLRRDSRPARPNPTPAQASDWSKRKVRRVRSGSDSRRFFASTSRPLSSETQHKSRKPEFLSGLLNNPTFLRRPAISLGAGTADVFRPPRSE